MIWIWIIAAVALSWLLCGRKTAWYHYIWIFLPIEMYGISIGGAIVKPYMVFGFIIIISSMQMKRKRELPMGIVGVILALAISDALNGLIVASIMQHIMFAIIACIAYGYTRMFSSDADVLSNIENVTIATTIGYGIIFSIAYLVYCIKPNFGGVYSSDRYATGMFLQFVSTGGISTVRLRGFCIDPNAMITSLIPGAAFAFERFMHQSNRKAYHMAAILSYICVVALSGSRMALLCTLIMIIIIAISGYRQTANKRKLAVSSALFALILFFIGIYYYRRILTGVYNYFTLRAGLNDDAGRLTIWKHNIEWLVENKRLLLGVGQNQIARLTTLRKACHNTWLEWICGTGIVIGGGIAAWFWFAPINLAKKMKQENVPFLSWQPLLFAYLTTAVCITTVDNITNSILIFLMIIFRYSRYLLFKGSTE